jgi:hypothetical protein
MSYVQRLELTLRHRGSNEQFTPVQIAANPEDIVTLQEQLREIAKDQDGRKYHGWPWQHEYVLRVVCLDSPWIDPFEIAGEDLE